MEPVVISLPPVAVLMLIAPSGAGKSTFAQTHFLPTEIIASDECRARVCDDPAAQSVSDDAFALLHFLLDLRLKNRRFTVVDSTAVKPSARAKILETATKRHAPVYAVVLDVPEAECVRRDSLRTDRSVGAFVIARQYKTFEQARREVLVDKRFAGVFTLTPDTVPLVEIVRGTPAMSGNRFDIIGDVHGCYGELCDLLTELGYDWDSGGDGLPRHPDGRIPVFVGDLADRGPKSPMVLRLAARLVAAGLALFAPGNHDDKLFRYLNGSKVTHTHGLDLTIEQLNALGDKRAELAADVLTYLATAPTHLVLDNGKLVVAHAGIRAEWIGEHHASVKAFTLYGDVRGFEPGTNKPLRHDWASEYDGAAFIAYGHTPAPMLNWTTDAATGRRFVAVPMVNNTANLDTGCVFGGALSAIRYPERVLYSVPARAIYAVHEGLPYSQSE